MPHATPNCRPPDRASAVWPVPRRSTSASRYIEPRLYCTLPCCMNPDLRTPADRFISGSHVDPPPRSTVRIQRSLVPSCTPFLRQDPGKHNCTLCLFHWTLTFDASHSSVLRFLSRSRCRRFCATAAHGSTRAIPVPAAARWVCIYWLWPIFDVIGVIVAMFRNSDPVSTSWI